MDSTIMFTNNLQVWLALFAFCALVVVELGRVIWGWWAMTLELSSWQWFLYVLGSLMVGICFVFGVIAFCGFVKLLYHAVFGQKLPYDAKEINETMLALIKPVKGGATIEECRTALARLITVRSETKGRLKTEVEKRISEYQSIIDELEGNT